MAAYIIALSAYPLSPIRRFNVRPQLLVTQDAVPARTLAAFVQFQQVYFMIYSEYIAIW